MCSQLLQKLKIFLPFWVLLVSPLALMAQTGSLSGTVTDSNTGDLMPGANLRIEGTSVGTATSSEGRFNLKGIPAGEQVLLVSYIGYQTKEVTVDIEVNQVATVTVALDDNFVELDGIMVQGNRQGQARALSQQKTSDNIKNVVAADLIGRFPDPNVADALRRVPAVSVQRDQGEARYIQVRGTNPTLSNVSVNGEQIPSPEGDVRFVALDMIPTDVLSSIEVNKAITPDMDGDAIGGSVNLNTLSAVEGGRVMKATLSAGYNNQNRDYSPLGGNGSFTYGNRIADNKFGYLVGASYNYSNRASDNNEMEYDEGDLEFLELRDYELTRERMALIGSFVYRFNPGSKLYLNTNYNYFSDQELRRAMGIESVEIAREFKDRFEEQKIFSLSGGGNHLITDRFEVDYSLSYSYADQNTPQDREVVFVQAYEDQNEEEIDFMQLTRENPDYPQFSTTSAAPAGAGAYNYDAFEFDGFENSSEQTSDKHFTSRLNMKLNYDLSDIYGELKFGGLYRAKNKERNPDIKIYDYDGDFLYGDVRGSFEDEDYLFGKYPEDVGLFPDEGKLGAFWDQNRSSFELEQEDSIEDTETERYSADEDTYAGYLMTTLRKGSVSGLIGARYEYTTVDYRGNQVEFDQNGDLLPVTSTAGSNDFGFFLPMLHLKYEMSDNANLRFAWTNSFSKPNYFDLAPYRLISREDEELEIGNPDLEATKSMNFDLMAEYYFNNVGVISAGLFYKQIDDFIYIRNYEYGQAPYNGYEATQPVNGEDADLFGFELNLQQQLTFLPGFASGFGVYANYTYSWSEANLITEEGAARTVSLPGQAENTGNLALSYEKYGFSGRVSLSYAGAFIDELRTSADNDRIYDEHVQLDVSASQQVTPGVNVFLELINLTNEPLRYYNGVSSRPEQQEYYSWWGNLGVKFNL
ncbi:TonB-dependent receptor [Aliifodinibius sp. S!AR15-10]|uniref:TonB-dependent receptor n=1 Tax=Aliifodinibius sp. S!AR15-10 TaxID=2950437 RepID=UPI0028644DB2|nr:TonB-dependent receptor [Aliifodinibius sp. S!AR15-10]MDR8394224.1 TonB-dependent receptor [Aliifodinibius sp. S!AR15-10]